MVDRLAQVPFLSTVLQRTSSPRVTSPAYNDKRDWSSIWTRYTHQVQEAVEPQIQQSSSPDISGRRNAKAAKATQQEKEERLTNAECMTTRGTGFRLQILMTGPSPRRTRIIHLNRLMSASGVRMYLSQLAVPLHQLNTSLTSTLRIVTPSRWASKVILHWDRSTVARHRMKTQASNWRTTWTPGLTNAYLSPTSNREVIVNVVIAAVKVASNRSPVARLIKTAVALLQGNQNKHQPSLTGLVKILKMRRRSWIKMLMTFKRLTLNLLSYGNNRTYQCSIRSPL